MTAVTISQRAAIPTDTAIRPKHSIEPMPYDAIGRLTETGVSNSEKTKTTGYQYDKVGNRLYQTVEDGTKTVSTKYTYNALGQLTQTQKEPGHGGQCRQSWLDEARYTYDENGNQTGKEMYLINQEVTDTEKIGDVRVYLR